MLPSPFRTHSSHLTRRRFVTAAAGSAVAVVLAGCGSDGDAGSGAESQTGEPPVPGSGAVSNGESVPVSADLSIVQRFPQSVAVPGPLRLPISLASPEGDLLQSPPAELTATVVDIDGNAVGAPITATRRDATPAPYYDFTPTIEEIGVYALVIDGGPADGASFQVSDPSTVVVPIPGSPLEPFDTPTVDDGRGVDPICTHEPSCPFHEITLTEALASGKQVVYFVGTPAFCTTGVCAPGLDSLIELAPAFADGFVFVHAEVYTDDTARTVAPSVEATGLFYEPAIFFTDADGVVMERLDTVWNTDELRETLERVSG